MSKNNHNQIESDLKKRGFCTLYSLDNFKTSFHDAELCGIYLLLFLNGDIYIGQSTNIRQRLRDHQSTYDDLRCISFKHVPKHLLSVTEADEVNYFEEKGYHLRNILLTSITYTKSSFDDIMPLGQQEAWVAGELDILEAANAKPSSSKNKYHRKFQLLREKPYFEPLTDIIGSYVARCIPYPSATQRDYWSISCLDTADGIYGRISIYKQEVFSFGFINNSPNMHWMVAKSHLLAGHFPAVTKMLLRFQQIDLQNFRYRPAGSDQIWVGANAIQSAKALLRKESFIRAARQLNINLMRKGTNLFSRYHCDDLASLILPCPKT